MEMDIPLTDLFWCPACGFQGLFKAEPAALVKCICGRWWVIGDYNDGLRRDAARAIGRGCGGWRELERGKGVMKPLRSDDLVRW